MLGDLSGERKKQKPVHNRHGAMVIWRCRVHQRNGKKKLLDRFRLMPNLELYPTTFTHIYNSDGGRKKKPESTTGLSLYKRRLRSRVFVQSRPTVRSSTLYRRHHEASDCSFCCCGGMFRHCPITCRTDEIQTHQSVSFRFLSFILACSDIRGHSQSGSYSKRSRWSSNTVNARRPYCVSYRIERYKATIDGHQCCYRTV